MFVPRHRVDSHVWSLIVVLALFLAGCGSDKTHPPIVQPDPPDGAAPLAPIGLGVTSQTDTKFELTWTASTEPDLAGYHLYLYDPSPERENSYVSMTGTNLIQTPQMTIAGRDSFTYYFRVSALDASGNESAMSEIYSFVFSSPEGDAPSQAGDDLRDGGSPESEQPSGDPRWQEAAHGDLPIRK